MFSSFLTVGIVGLMVTSSSFCAKIDLKNKDTPKSSRHLATAALGYSYREAQDRYANMIKSTENCDTLITDAERREIASYQAIANTIMAEVVNGSFKGETFKELANFVDLHPVRTSGFSNLENAIDYMMERMKQFGIQNVRGEQVLVPHWVRGEERAEMRSPHKKTIRILGLGSSVGTPEEGITADVIVVKSFDDLESKKDQVKGKIVVFNQGWLGSYGATNIYRSSGASRAAQHGAIAALIQSIAPFSLDTPHTGGQNYSPDVPHIPAACITMEDADFLWRLQEKNQQIQIYLKMLDYNMPLTTSRNVIGELTGRAIKDQYVGVSGHIDSWDLGQGAMDDAGGVMISVMALAVLKHLNLQPRRTLQAILWTSEEVGLWGVDDFAKQHKDHLANYSVVFESDSGTFRPRGLDFAGSEKAGCIVNEVLKLTAAINTTEYARYASVSSDITRLQREGVPGLSLNTQNDVYFWYHHTEADTITMMDADELDLNTALWAVTSYVLSDIENKLHRDPPAP